MIHEQQHGFVSLEDAVNTAEDDEGGALDIMTPPLPSEESERAWGFLLCICARMALAYCYRFFIDAVVPRVLLIGLVFIMATVWLLLWITASQPPCCWALLEEVWWAYMRPIHASTYLAAGIMALLPNFRAHAWLPLGADVLIAAFVWLAHHMYKE